MHKRYSLVVLFLLLLLFVPQRTLHAAGNDSQPTLADFDQAVLTARQHMRQFCSLIQEVIRQEERTTVQKALKEITAAADQWQTVQEAFATTPPAEYAGDPQFAAGLKTIALLLDEMRSDVEAGKYKISFFNCAFTCGLFVKMHEENGLVYAADRLFHLRKSVKTAAAAANNNNNNDDGVDGVSNLLQVMQQQRDRVLAAPCPVADDAEKCKQYQAEVKTIAGLIDELTLNLANEHPQAAKEIMPRLLSTINRAYGLAL